MRHILHLGNGLFLLVMLLAGPTEGRADGLVIDPSLRYVPEKEQTAFIEWDTGWQQLDLSTRTEASTTATLWIVPIPAPASQVTAEPIMAFPRVAVEQSIVKRSLKILDEARVWAVPLTFGVGTTGTFATVADGLGGGGVQVHQHVEKLGMVVEVLTADLPAALDAYLGGKKLKFRTADIAVLAPYLRSSAALMCAWLAAPSRDIQARAVRIKFPTPAVYYPLRPTSVYESEIKTVIYVRGLFQPRADQTVPGMSVRYVLGEMATVPAATSSQGIVPIGKTHRPFVGEPLTRIELTGSPRAWTNDLLLDPGAPPAISVAHFVVSSALFPWLALVLLGAVVASVLPWVTLPQPQRGKRDFLWAFLVGAVIGLSMYLSALVFALWMSRHNPPRERFHWKRALPWALLWGVVQLLAQEFVGWEDHKYQERVASSPVKRTLLLKAHFCDLMVGWGGGAGIRVVSEQIMGALIYGGFAMLLTWPMLAAAGRKSLWLILVKAVYAICAWLLLSSLLDWIALAEDLHG